MKHLLFALVFAAGTLLQLGAQEPAGKPGTEPPRKDPALDLYFSANGLYNRKLYPLAARQFEEFLAKYKGHEKTRQVELGLALSYMADKQPAKAEPLLARLAADANAPNRDHVLLLRGQALMQQGKLAEAENAYFEGARLATKDDYKTRCRLGLCETLYQQQKWPELEKEAKALGDALPARGRYQLAAAQRQQKRAADAAATLRPLAGIDAKDPLAQHVVFLLAECEREAEQLDAAAAAYTRAGGLPGPFTAQAKYLLGVTRLDQGRADEAIKTLAAMLKDHKDDPVAPKAQVALGRAHLAKRDWRNLDSTLRPLLAEAEVGPEAGLWLGRGLMNQDKPGDAATVLASAAKAAADDHPLLPGLLFDLARAHSEAEVFEEAAAAYGDFAQRFPGHSAAPDALHQQAAALNQAGRFPDSVAACDRFLAAHAAHSNAHEVAFLRAENLHAAKRTNEAASAFGEFVAKHAASARVPFARFRLGQIQFDQGKWKEALAALEPVRADKDIPAAGYLAGASAYRAELWEQAVQCFGEHLAAHPKSPRADLAHLTMALAELRRDRGDEAAKVLESFVAERAASPHLPQALAELGKLRYRAEQHAEALQVLAKVPAASAHHAEALYYQGFACLGLEQEDKAVGHFAALVNAYPEHELAPDARLQQGLALLNAENYPEAQKQLEALLAKPGGASPDKIAQATYGLGLAHARQKQWPAAAAQLAKVPADSEFRPRALYELAWAHKEQADTNAAVTAYTDLLAAHADHDVAPAAAFELGELEYRGGQLEAATKRLSELLPKVGERELRDNILLRLGWCHIDADNQLDAAKTFETLLAESPESPRRAQAAFQAGEARFRLKEFAPALAHYQLCLDKADAQLAPQALLRLGEAQALTEAHSAAQATYAKFLAEHGDDPLAPRARLGLGWALENQGKHDEAVAAYAEVIAGGAKTETAARAQFQIGECHFAAKRYDEAILAFNAVEVNYGFPEWQSKALLELGRCLAEQGDATAAAERFDEVIARYAATPAATVAKEEKAKLAP